MDAELLRGGLGDDAALEIAFAGALLAAVATGGRQPIVRAYRPLPTVAFGRRDAFLPGFGRAAAAARERGFAPVLRAQGGRAAAYDGGCLVFDEVVPAQDSIAHITERFAAEAQRHAQALRRLGVDARVGEVPGEYCPGAFSVNARGERKLAGSAQRLVRGGWLLSTVVVVQSAAQIRDVLDDVYAALELDWDPASAGAVADEVPGVALGTVEQAMLETYAERYGLVSGTIRAPELAAARGLIERHRVNA